MERIKKSKAEKRASRKNPAIAINKKNRFFIYGWMAWPIIFFLVFSVGMNATTIWNSFFVESIDKTYQEFVGFSNYARVFTRILLNTDPNEGSIMFYRALVNSLSLAPLALLINLPLTLLFAYAIYKKILLHKFFRIVLFIPAIVSTVVLCLSFRAIVDDGGAFNAVLRMMGLAGDGTDYNPGIIPVEGWLGNKDTVWGTILVFSVWTGISGNLIYFTSAMARLPEEIFESAELDGATAFRILISFVIPLVWPVITTLSIQLVSAVFSWFIPTMLLAPNNKYASTLCWVLMSQVKSGNTGGMMAAFGVLIGVIGGIVVICFKKLMESVFDEVQY